VNGGRVVFNARRMCDNAYILVAAFHLPLRRRFQHLARGVRDVNGGRRTVGWRLPPTGAPACAARLRRATGGCCALTRGRGISSGSCAGRRRKSVATLLPILRVIWHIVIMF